MKKGLPIFALLIVAAQSLYSQDQITVKETVPQWAKSAVWYQIFPERFRNGDPSNDPKLKDIIGADPAEMPKEWQIHPWGSDWHKLQPYEVKNGEPELWKHILRRRYGGDFQGIIDKLDYIKQLGFNAIYLNPVFDSPSLHKYDGASYHHADPNFGPDPEGDRRLIESENPLDPSTWVWTKADELLLKLIKECHKREIKVILDGVFNHMGVNSFAFQDLLKNQEKSPYKDWFIVKSFNDSVKGTVFDYEGWFGVKSLPEFKEDANGIVKGPRDYIFAATQRWMNPKGEGIENGIDGWRLDVAFCVGHKFWKDWRNHVKSINPEAYLTAEIVQPPQEVLPYLSGDEFDGEMSYNFAFACAEFFFDPKGKNISPTEFDQKLRELREIYPGGIPYVVQNLFGSHDSNRLGSYILNRGIGKYRNWGEYFNLSQASSNKNYNTSKPGKEEIRLQKIFILFQMTNVGAPMVYYGDEVGMWGANDPDCRKPMIWEDIQYEDSDVSINSDLFDFYKRAISIRRNNVSLNIGDFQTLITNDSENLYAFMRSFAKQKIVVVINNSDSDKVIQLPIKGKFKQIPLFDNIIIKENMITIGAKEGAILELTN
ncbi:MAG: glycoside hydrolase family 13 protein [Bacteroidales bacterium]